MERGLGISSEVNTMTKLELKQRVREQQQAAKELKLKYRGVAYNKWSGDLWGVRFPPSFIGIGPVSRIPFAV